MEQNKIQPQFSNNTPNTNEFREPNNQFHQNFETMPTEQNNIHTDLYEENYREPIEPIEPIEPREPIEPIEPMEPMEPIEPEIPVYSDNTQSTTKSYVQLPLYHELDEDSTQNVNKQFILDSSPTFETESPALSKQIVLPQYDSNYSDSDSDNDDDDYNDDDETQYNSVSKTDESYSYNGNIYTVSVSECLQKDLQVLHHEKEYRVYLCLYKVCMNSYSPYLTYVLNKKDNLKINTQTYQFPSYSFQLSSIHNPLSPRSVKKMTGGSDDSHKFEAEFMEELYQQVYSYCLEPQQIPNIEDYYRGFYIKDELSDEIFVVIDITKIGLINGEHVLATPYEILISRQVLEIAVHPSTTNFLMSVKEEEGNMDFYHIQKEDGQYLESPYVLYMCKSNGLRGYINAVKDNNMYAEIVYPRIHHPELDAVILFTSHAFDVRTAANLRRYLVFAEKANTLYIEADSDTNLDDILTDRDYNVVTYIDKDSQKQMWCVSTPIIVDELH